MAANGDATNEKCVLDDFKGTAIFKDDNLARLELCQKDSYFMCIYEEYKLSYLLDLNSADIIVLNKKCRSFTDGDVIIYTVNINDKDDSKLKQIAGFDGLKKATIYLNKMHDLIYLSDPFDIFELSGNLEVKIPKFWEKINNIMEKNNNFQEIINKENAKIQILKKICTIIYKHEEIINENENDLINIIYESPDERTQLDRNIFRAFINLQAIDLSKSSIETLDSNLFKGLKQLESVNLSYNKISCIMSELFNSGLENLTNINLNENQIIKLPAELNVKSLKVLTASFNEISNLEANVFKNLTNLKEVYFNKNLIKELNRELFQTNEELIKVQFNDNNISNLPFGLFMSCVNLTEICFARNNIEKLDAFIFRGLNKLAKIDFSYNKISVLNSDIFTGLEGLNEVDFSFNRISRLHPHIFKLIINLDDQQSTTKNIKVDFRFDYENTIFLSWDYLRVYNEFFRKNSLDGKLEIEDEVFKEYMIMLALSQDNDKRSINPFDLETSLKEEKDKNELLNKYFAQSPSFIQSSSFTLLDFFLLCKGISTKMLESILEKVKTNMKNSEQSEPESLFELNTRINSKKFGVSNYESVERLCEFGNQKLIQDLESYFNVSSFKECIDAALKKNNESVAIGFVKIFWKKIKEEYKSRDKSKTNFQDIVCKYKFYLNDCLKRCFDEEWWLFYKELLDIYKQEKDSNSEMRHFYLTLFEKDYNREETDQDESNGVNQQPELEKKSIFKNSENIRTQSKCEEIDETNRLLFDNKNLSRMGCGVSSILDRQDTIKDNNMINKQDKQKDNTPKEYKKLEFSKMNNIKVDQHLLYFINKSERDELIRNYTTKKTLKLKWKWIPTIIYWGHLAFYLLYLFCYFLYLYYDKISKFNWAMITCLVLLFVFTFEEICQLVALGWKYFKDLQNFLEMVTFPVCFLNLFPNVLPIEVNDVIYVVTIITSFGILILRLKNINFKNIGVYATVFEKVILKSFNVIPLVTISVFAFVFAFKVTRKSFDLEENKLSNDNVNRSDEDHIKFYNGSSFYSFVRVLTMSLGEYTTSKMGLNGRIDTFTLVSNYIAYVLFIFILPILVINMFIGISVDEMRKLIEKSENRNIKTQIEYVLNIQEIRMSIESSKYVFSCLRKFLKNKKFQTRIIDKCKDIIKKEKKQFKKCPRQDKEINEIKDQLEKTYKWYRYSNLLNNLLNKLDRTNILFKMTNKKTIETDPYLKKYLEYYISLLGDYKLGDYKKQFPKNSNHLATTLYNIGLLYEKLEEEYKKALDYFKEALEIRKRILGIDEVGQMKKELEKTYTWYSILLKKLNRTNILFIGNKQTYYYDKYCLNNYKSLLGYYKLGDYKKQFPKNPNHIATTLYNIGLLYEKSAEEKEYNKALDYFKEALEIRKRILGLNEKQMLAGSKKQIKINTDDVLKELLYRNKLLEDRIENIRKEIENSSIKQNSHVDERLLKIDERTEGRFNDIYAKFSAQDNKFETVNEQNILMLQHIIYIKKVVKNLKP